MTTGLRQRLLECAHQVESFLSAPDEGDDAPGSPSEMSAGEPFFHDRGESMHLARAIFQRGDPSATCTPERSVKREV